MPDLEQRLLELGEAIDWPAIQPLRVPVPTRAAAGPRRSARVPTSRWILAAAAAIVMAAIALGAYPPSRDAIAGWLNLHTRVIRVQQAPTPSPLPSGRLGSELGLGDRTTLDGARSSVSWTISVPDALGAPDAVYLQKDAAAPSGGEVSLVYGARAGIPVSAATGVSVLVTEARGRVDQVFFQKILGGGASIEQVSVGGRSAYWITGTHTFVFVDADGNPRFETLRIAANVLVVDRGGTIVRIEGDLTRDQAMAIAQSLA